MNQKLRRRPRGLVEFGKSGAARRGDSERSRQETQTPPRRGASRCPSAAEFPVAVK